MERVGGTTTRYFLPCSLGATSHMYALTRFSRFRPPTRWLMRDCVWWICTATYVPKHTPQLPFHVLCLDIAHTLLLYFAYCCRQQPESNKTFWRHCGWQGKRDARVYGCISVTQKKTCRTDAAYMYDVTGSDSVTVNGCHASDALGNLILWEQTRAFPGCIFGVRKQNNGLKKYWRVELLVNHTVSCTTCSVTSK